MTHDSFLTHSRKRLDISGRQKTSEDISGHLVTSGLSRIFKIKKLNFGFQPLGGAGNSFFRYRHRDQKVAISNSTNLYIFSITITLVLKARLRRVETLCQGYRDGKVPRNFFICEIIRPVPGPQTDQFALTVDHKSASTLFFADVKLFPINTKQTLNPI